MQYKSVLLYIVYLGCLVMPGLSYGFASGAGDGGGNLSNSMIVHLAESYDVKGAVALKMLESLGEEELQDLKLLQRSPSKACAVYFMCDEITETFFRVVLDEVVDRKNGELLASDRKWSYFFTGITAFFAFVGTGLGVLNYRQVHHRNT